MATTARSRRYGLRRTAALKTFSATFRERDQSALTSDGSRVFRGVTLIKSGLGNAADRHYYPAPVLKEAVESGMFEKLRAYADHPTRVDDTIQPERTIRDQVGIYTNVRFVREGEREGRVVGDLNVFKSQRWLADNVDDLKRWGAADRIGISINGQGDTEAKVVKEAGGEVNEVQAFRRLASADIVTEAGAGGGFSALMESARAAHKERMTMGKKELLAKIAEAAKKGDAVKVDQLTKKLQECMAEEGADKSKPAAKATKTKEAKKKPPVEDDEDVREADEADDDTDDVDETDDEETDEDTDDVQESDDEGDEASDDEDTDDADEDVQEARRSGGARMNVASARDKFNRTKTIDQSEAKRRAGEVEQTTRENALYVAKPKKMRAHGGSLPPKGKGSFVKKAREADVEPDTGADDTESLREALDAVEAENRQLKARIAKTQREAAAAKVAKKFTSLDKRGQAALAAKLVRECRTYEEMQREAGFYSQLLEGATRRTRDELFGDDEGEEGINGMPARFRESYSGAAGETTEDLLSDVGLPIKREQSAD